MSGPTMRPGGNGAGPGGNGSSPAGPRPGAGMPPGVRPGQLPPGAPPPGMRRPGPGGGGMTMGLMMPTAKPSNFRASFRRLAGLFAQERMLIALVIVMAVVSVSFAVIGPKILGNATNEIFNGVISKNLPAGVSKDQIVAGIRARGNDQLADMVAAMDLHPGQGIDFGALAGILYLLIGLYLLSAVFSWAQTYVMAGVTQRTVYRLRTDVDAKLGRLPLKYFDSHPRGDVLSRVTNDIDNIGQTLYQSLTQIITSLLTIIGVLVLMLTISWQLAVISILAVPASVIVTLFIAKRSQQRFAAQWASTGALNGHVEEMHTGHAIVKVFGRQEQAIETFDRENEKLYQASYQAQFISGTIQPAMTFISNLNYVAIAVIGGLRVASGQMTLGDVIAFI